MAVPKKIYLQWHGDADPADYPNGPDPDENDVTWCIDKIYDHDIEYVLVDEITRLRAELAECKQDAKHRITRLRDALANLHGNCYVADAPTEMIAAEEALAAEALDAARKGEGE